MDSSQDFIVALWGNVSTLSTTDSESGIQHFPRGEWNDWNMAKQKEGRPRDTLAKNLRALLKAHDMSGPKLAIKAGIDRKSVNNMVNARFNPDLDNVDAVAKVFGLTAWQLIMPDVSMAFPMASDVRKLLERYSSATEQDRQTILTIAEMTGSHRTLRLPSPK